MQGFEISVVGSEQRGPRSSTPKRPGAALLALLAGIPLFLLACGATAPKHEHPQPLSVSEHEREAEDHDAQAQVTQGRVEAQGTDQDVQCVDIGGPLESGGESMPVMKPCWTKAEQNASYTRAAQRQRAAAKDHRRWAKLLLEAEAEACQSLAQSERETSPFTRSADILSVSEYQEHSKAIGAKVTFRKVPGLSKEWFQASIRCHQARAAKLGYDTAYMTHCPLVLEKVGTSVEETESTLVITLRSTDPVIAAEIYGRVLLFQDGDADEKKPQ